MMRTNRRAIDRREAGGRYDANAPIGDIHNWQRSAKTGAESGLSGFQLRVVISYWRDWPLIATRRPWFAAVSGAVEEVDAVEPDQCCGTCCQSGPAWRAPNMR